MLDRATNVTGMLGFLSQSLGGAMTSAKTVQDRSPVELLSGRRVDWSFLSFQQTVCQCVALGDMYITGRKQVLRKRERPDPIPPRDGKTENRGKSMKMSKPKNVKRKHY